MRKNNTVNIVTSQLLDSRINVQILNSVKLFLLHSIKVVKGRVVMNNSWESSVNHNWQNKAASLKYFMWLTSSFTFSVLPSYMSQIMTNFIFLRTQTFLSFIKKMAQCNWHCLFDVSLLQFQSFHLEDRYEGDCFDFVIFAQTESQLNKNNTICGLQTAAGLRSLSLISDGNYAVIKFVSDDKIARTGYDAVFYSIPPGMYKGFMSKCRL